MRLSYTTSEYILNPVGRSGCAWVAAKFAPILPFPVAETRTRDDLQETAPIGLWTFDKTLFLTNWLPKPLKKLYIFARSQETTNVDFVKFAQTQASFAA
jgi:hypothetical protein